MLLSAVALLGAASEVLTRCFFMKKANNSSGKSLVSTGLRRFEIKNRSHPITSYLSILQSIDPIVHTKIRLAILLPVGSVVTKTSAWNMARRRPLLCHYHQHWMRLLLLLLSWSCCVQSDSFNRHDAASTTTTLLVDNAHRHAAATVVRAKHYNPRSISPAFVVVQRQPSSSSTTGRRRVAMGSRRRPWR